MRKKKNFEEKVLLNRANSESNLSSGAVPSSWLSQNLLAYYKQKSSNLEKKYNSLFETIDDIKSNCISTHELQLELHVRNEEVSRLQELIGHLQLNLFKLREELLTLTAENDKMIIEDIKNKKIIKMLLPMANGLAEKKIQQIDLKKEFSHLKLPSKLQKLKDQKEEGVSMCLKKSTQECHSNNLMQDNQMLISHLEQQIKISKEHVEVLLKEKVLISEEKAVEIKRMQNEINHLSSKLNESQILLCETAEKLIKSEQTYEREKAIWMEEKNKFVKKINFFKISLGESVSSACDCREMESNVQGFCCAKEAMNQKILEKEKSAAADKEKILTLQKEVSNLREQEYVLKQILKEKSHKMATQLSYFKNKYEDLNRRRQLEAEGFRTDIKMLRARMKAIEKKIKKTANEPQNAEQQLLLDNATSILQRAKLLEKELVCVKSKINDYETNNELPYYC